MLVQRIRHNFPISDEYNISRVGLNCYCFFHFTAPTKIILGKQVIHTRSNACILYAPNTARCVVNYQPCLMNWIHISKDAAPLIEKYSIPLDTVFYPTDISFITTVFRNIEIEYFSNDPHSETLANYYLEEFMIKLNRALQNDRNISQLCAKEQLKLYQVRQAILSSPSKKWTVPEIAKLAALSPSRFHCVYKSLFGTTPIRDILEAKIDYAKTLLLADDYVSIQDVTEKLGYSSPYYFITKFKAITGISPGAYRKSNK